MPTDIPTVGKEKKELSVRAIIIACTVAIVEATKEWGYIKRIPTQIWSFVITFILVVLWHLKSDESKITGRTFCKLAVEALILSFASNGTFVALDNLSMPMAKAIVDGLDAMSRPAIT
jgi:hypothetical protein